MSPLSLLNLADSLHMKEENSRIPGKRMLTATSYLCNLLNAIMKIEKYYEAF